MNHYKNVLVFLLFAGSHVCQGQTTIYHNVENGTLYIQKHVGEYHNQAEKDPAYQMVELKALIPSIQFDFRYSTLNNFTGQRLYPKGLRVSFLRYQPAYALKKIQENLAKEGLGIKVFDAYRPYSVTCRFWKLIGDERYVANPAKGSGHNRGIAIDLTVIDLKSGKELEMGTDFDDFSDKAHHTYTQLPQQMLNNRRKLKKIMEDAGFISFETEWWHYSWPNDKNYPVMDIPFNKMNEIRVKK